MKKIFYLCVLVLGLFNCNNRHENNAKKISIATPDSISNHTQKAIQPIDTIQIDPTKIDCPPSVYRYGDDYNESCFSPGTFGKKTYMYDAANLKAKIIDSLKFNSPVNILAEYSDFFLICNYNGKSGYVKKCDLYLHSFFGTYLFGISSYGSFDNHECNTSKLRVIKINHKNEILNVFNDSILGKDYHIEQISDIALKNAAALFYLSYHCYNEIGVWTDHFIIDNGKQISCLILGGGDGDGGISNESAVYLPIRLVNGKKIVLAKNGKLSLNPMTATPDIFIYPKNLKIPIDELIVVQEKEIESGIWDDKTGEQIYNNDGTTKEIVSNVITSFYQWDGSTIHKVKTVKGKY